MTLVARRLSADAWVVDVDGVSVTVTAREFASPRLLQIRLADALNIVIPRRALRNFEIESKRKGAAMKC